MEDCSTIVLDNGSHSIKIGYSGDDTPRSTFNSTVGMARNPEWSTPHHSSSMNSNSGNGNNASSAASASAFKADPREYYVGKDCQVYRDHLDLSQPIERGVITDWDAMTKIWEYAFSHELRLHSESLAMPVLCTLAPPYSKQQMEKMAQMMFESYKVSGFYIMQQCVLSLFASGRTRGIVVEAGHGSCHAVPIFEGYALPHATLHLNVGGVDITNHLEQLLSKNGYNLKGCPTAMFTNMKETLCYTTSSGNSTSDEGNSSGREGNAPNEVQNAAEDDAKSEKPFELPDGTIINVDNECRRDAVNVLFNTNVLPDDHKSKGLKNLPELVAQSINMCDKDLQTDLRQAVVLAGGTTMMPGFSKRFHLELETHLTQPAKVVPDYNVRERGYNTHRQIAAWIGGSMFASLPTFKDIIITRQEWEEYHESILDRKCF